MTEIVNLRTVRKRAKRRLDEQQAEAQRLAHGSPKHVRSLEIIRREQESRTLDGHKITPGEHQ
ncbi:DUF4169 family protein [Undibacter mobilis]|nr:DUF4169 family protein [Undibacter mobilis]